MNTRIYTKYFQINMRKLKNIVLLCILDIIEEKKQKQRVFEIKGVQVV